MVVGRRTNVLLDNNTHLLYQPEHVTKVARQRGKLFQISAEDYFFIAFNDFPWHRVPDVVIGRIAYDNFLVGLAIHDDVTVVDATATLLAFHQTGSDGEKAGFKNKDVDVNIIRIGQLNYGSGFTSSAQCETRFEVIVKSTKKTYNNYKSVNSAHKPRYDF